MKVSIKSEHKNYLAPPTPFFKVETPTTKEHVSNANTHEVRYSPTDADSKMYKLYSEPFSTGTPKQWLEFKRKLKMIIMGNNLTMGPKHFNMTLNVLKDEALQVFHAEANKLGMNGMANHECNMQAVTNHLFLPNVFACQKHFCDIFFTRLAKL